MARLPYFDADQLPEDEEVAALRVMSRLQQLDYAWRLGMDKEEPLNRFLTKIPSGRFAPALGEATLCGIAIDVDDATGLARAIAPLRIGGKLSQAEPNFWTKA